jgi:ferredoxin-like protein FixX
LAALVPKPRVNLTRFHGVFAPNSKHRALVTPAKRGKGNKSHAHNETEERTLVERHSAITWAQRLNRVFNIDIESCVECGGAVKVIACIEDPVVIEKILSHLEGKAATQESNLLPESRAPPPVCMQAGLFY